MLIPVSVASAEMRNPPTHPLRGLHDGAEWLFNAQLPGWAVEPLYSHGDLSSTPIVDGSRYQQAGVRLIVRLNYSYAKGDGGQGTFPHPDRYADFINWCLRIIYRSRSVWGWIIGNEPNRAAERPDPHRAITPADVLHIYNTVWYHARTTDRLSPPSIDPTNYESGDPRGYWQTIVNELRGAEFFALHAYSYGPQQPVDTRERFNPPMGWQYYGFRMWEPFAAVLYNYRRDGVYPWRRLPIVISETNHLFRDHVGGPMGWNPSATFWIRDVFDYVRRWNEGPGSQFVHAICLYRHRGDVWRIDDKPALLDALRQVG
ncbi:MAG: hypothetical protein H6637_04995 [Ardenticatenales bacterium]|nr:hypothetical protein [Ardenticatenales bacterium]